ncbi:hypothetical protein BDZ97DRAFT_2025976 [Flammula alnicola]|nr:hypothetical protein BDZ97DRAFT_2025976 [Flammula alnicola]
MTVNATATTGAGFLAVRHEGNLLGSVFLWVAHTIKDVYDVVLRHSSHVSNLNDRRVDVRAGAASLVSRVNLDFVCCFHDSRVHYPSPPLTTLPCNPVTNEDDNEEFKPTGSIAHRRAQGTGFQMQPLHQFRTPSLAPPPSPPPAATALNNITTTTTLDIAATAPASSLDDHTSAAYGGVDVEIGVEDGGEGATPHALNLNIETGRRRNTVDAPDVTPHTAVVDLPMMTVASKPPPPLHLPRMQERDGGGLVSTFEATTASPPPSHARARRRRIGFDFRSRRHVSTSLACKSETEVDWFRLSKLPPPLHLPRMQERVRGGLVSIFEAAAASPPPSHARARRRRIGFDFRSRRHVSTSLALKSESEVDWFRFSKPPPRLHLPRMQERVRGGLVSIFEATTTAAPPSHARASVE